MNTTNSGTEDEEEADAKPVSSLPKRLGALALAPDASGPSDAAAQKQLASIDAERLKQLSSFLDMPVLPATTSNSAQRSTLSDVIELAREFDFVLYLERAASAALAAPRPLPTSASASSEAAAAQAAPKLFVKDLHALRTLLLTARPGAPKPSNPQSYVSTVSPEWPSPATLKHDLWTHSSPLIQACHVQDRYKAPVSDV
jgi:hypothetical protein